MPHITLEYLVWPKTARKYLGMAKEGLCDFHWDENKIRVMSQDMREGRFRHMESPITFNKDNKLIDGRQRLKAVILADCPVRMRVLFEREANELVDEFVKEGQSILAALQRQLLLAQSLHSQDAEKRLKSVSGEIAALTKMLQEHVNTQTQDMDDIFPAWIE